MSVWWLKICAACQAPFSLSKHSIRWSFARIYFKISWAYMIHVQNPFCFWVFRQRDVVQMCFRLAEQHAIAACWGACPCTHEEPVFLSFAVSPPTKTKTKVVTHTKRTDAEVKTLTFHLHHNTVHMALQGQHQWRERGQPPWRYPFGPQLLYVVLNQISMHHVHVHVVPDRTQHLVVCSSTNLAWSALVFPH